MAENEGLPEVLLGKGGPSQAGWHGLEAFLECPKKAQFMLRGIRKPAAQTPDALAVGSMFHNARARWFKHRCSTSPEALEDVSRAIEESTLEASLPVRREAELTARKFMDMYIEHYSKRPLPKPVAAEYLLGPAPLAESDPFFLFRTARLDDVSRYPEAGGRLCIGEAKTTSTSIADTANQYTLHGQPMMQVALWKMAPQGEAMHGPIAGVLLDIFKKPYANQKADFGRVFVPINEHAMNWYVKSIRGYLKAYSGMDWNSAAPRNITSCTRIIGRARVPCQFRELCMSGESASILYTLAKGESLRSWQSNPEREVPPWE